MVDPTPDARSPLTEVMPAKSQRKAPRSKHAKILQSFLGILIGLASVFLIILAGSLGSVRQLTAPGGRDGSLPAAESSPAQPGPSTSPSTTQDEAFDNSKTYINTAPAAPALPPSKDPPSTGSVMVAFPSRVPILKGGVAAHDIHGFGAIVCPDSRALAAWVDSFPAPKSGGESDEVSKGNASGIGALRHYGCSYFPPGTPMISDGGSPSDSWVVVRVNLSDGRTVSGVTFSDWIVQNEQQSEGSPERSEPSTPTALRVSVEQLYRDYQSSTSEGDQDYKGKLLEVSGRVDSIYTDFLDVTYIRLEGSNDSEHAAAHVMRSEKSKVAELSKGEPITLLCSGNGVMNDIPLLADCVIQLK